MPTGVASDLLRVIEGDLRSDKARLWTLAVVGALLFAPAWYLAQAGGLVVHAGALAGGVGVGLLVGHRSTRRYEVSLRSTWREWNRFSVACHSVGELHRKVRGRAGRSLPFLYAAVLTGIWALEVLLLTLALADATAFWWSFVAVAGNGLLVGGLVGFHLRARRWTRELRSSIQDMVQRGEIGVWGTI